MSGRSASGCVASGRAASGCAASGRAASGRAASGCAASSRRSTGRWSGPIGAVLALWGGLGCIIPDSGIDIEDQYANMGAVRIVEPTPVTLRADDQCDELPGVSLCPRIPDTLPSGLIRPETPLCVCSQGDLGLGGFEIFVEDPDVDEAGDPRDDIIGAFFLDMPAVPDDPRDHLAYTNQLPPEEPARRFRADDVRTIQRPDPNLKAWTIAGQSRWDLCNDNDGAKVEAGLHQLQLIVTDRPWYRPPLFDAAGRPLTDEDGNPQFDDPVIGMPDLRAGATYDTTRYVFECYDNARPSPGITCSCESI